MKKLTVALLSGGVSSEREVSLNSGRQVHEVLNKEKYAILRYDPKTDLPRLVADASKIDVALIILHGPFGEDGTIQGLLDLLGIPYQGSGVIGSALAMNKLASKRLYEKAGLAIPPYRAITPQTSWDPKGWMDQLGMPLVVKPANAGSSVGITIVRDPEGLKTALDDAFAHDDTILLEQHIAGIELTGGVLGNESIEALPLIEIIPNPNFEFFDYKAKYTAGASQEICPARIPKDITEKAQACAVKAHQTLFCRGYSRTDMILKGMDVYVLETNTIPGMTATSLLPQAAAKAGIPFGALLDRLIDLAMEDKKRRAAFKSLAGDSSGDSHA
ncbi:MAG: D-alanine--D-alanine ligase [Desulfobacterales bacterium CG07_land_8_20_14_0_80_52_14]|nr:MAG: D-alanine--D-alanine ligase [Desulfobacterales bacterium CG23_combo_of_CG06-09_8_20_14_all_52_9]PIU49707.1 MAG: D-alanine--D-alanine ligase [Desulfobacterales bacterium CG07_land_8_20_14_0_80_52_14]